MSQINGVNVEYPGGVQGGNAAPYPHIKGACLDQADPVGAIPSYPSFHEMLSHWLCKNESAISLMEDLLFIAARWDDLLDKDQVLLDKDINRLMEVTLSLPCQPFYIQHFAQLYPLLHNAIRNWKVSMTYERSPLHNTNQDAHELALINAFVLRSSYIDLVGHCAMLIAGNEWAEHVIEEARLVNSKEGFALYRQNLKREHAILAEHRR